MLARAWYPTRGLLGVVRLIQNPRALEQVFWVADALEWTEAAEPMVAELRANPRVDRALDERPRVGTIDLDALRALPDGTLGREFARLMDDDGLDPADLPVVEAEDPGAYLFAHLYETHDIWHVITGLPTDVKGELGLQAFYTAQIPGQLAPVLLAVGLLQTAFRQMDEREDRMELIARGWRMGRRARPLFGMRWAELWDRPVAELREELGIEPAFRAAA